MKTINMEYEEYEQDILDARKDGIETGKRAMVEYIFSIMLSQRPFPMKEELVLELGHSTASTLESILARLVNK
jgi:hypothetical protein